MNGIRDCVVNMQCVVYVSVRPVSSERMLIIQSISCPVSRYSQCSTTGITKGVVCVILSVE